MDIKNTSHQVDISDKSRKLQNLLVIKECSGAEKKSLGYSYSPENNQKLVERTLI